MAPIAGEIVINRPVDKVFDFVADERNEPRYNPRLMRAEQVSAGPIGAGTRFRAETRLMGRTVPMTIEFKAFERPRRLESSTHVTTMDIQGTLTFDPVPEGTRMRWSWQVRPRGMVALLGPLVAWMGRRQEAAIWAGLKRFLEAPASYRPDDATVGYVEPAISACTGWARWPEKPWQAAEEGLGGDGEAGAAQARPQ